MTDRRNRRQLIADLRQRLLAQDRSDLSRTVSASILQDPALRQEVSKMLDDAAERYAEAVPNDQSPRRYSATPFSLRIVHTFSGVIGMSMWRTPRCASASTTALAIAGGAPTVADSPTPFAPNG